MNKLFFLLSITLFGTNVLFSQSLDVETLRQKQLSNIMNPSLWDMNRMMNDIDPLDSSDVDMPFYFGAFPVPHYDSTAGFGGLGFGGGPAFPAYPEYALKVKDKDILYYSFFMGKNPSYPNLTKDVNTFFTIITVTDSLTSQNFGISKAHISSRNHPDYIGDGYFKNSLNTVDFTGFVTPEGHNFAIVNGRIFHLAYGNIILIAPHKDGTFRSMQLNEGELSDQEIYLLIKEDLTKREEIIEFFTNNDVL